MSIGERIKEARTNKGLSQGQLATALGLESQTSISHWETNKNNPGRSRMEQIAEILGVSREWLEFGYETAQKDATIKSLNTQQLDVVGYVEAGVWREAVEWESSKVYRVGVPRVPVEYKNPFCLEVRGPSMNEYYPDGSVVVCCKLLDMPRDLRNGDHVVVYLRRADGLVEATIKELVQDNDGKTYLVARSDHPKYSGSIDMDDVGDHDEVEIYAVVIGDFKWRF